MKVYHVPDLDGLVEAAIMAPNLDAAAAALGLTVRQMRERGWAQLKGPASTAARKADGAPLYRGLHGSGASWTASLEQARAGAAKAVSRRA